MVSRDLRLVSAAVIEHGRKATSDSQCCPISPAAPKPRSPRKHEHRTVGLGSPRIVLIRSAALAIIFIVVRSTFGGSVFRYTTFDFPGAATTQLRGVSGDNIVGTYQDQSGLNHAFIWDGSHFTTLDDPLATNGTFATGVSGTTVIGAYNVGAQTLGFVYDGSHYSTLNDPLAATGTVPFGIDEHTIVGGYTDRATGYNRGFIYDGSSYLTFDVPSATQTFLYAVWRNKIAGAYHDAGGASRAFVYDGASFTMLGKLYATGVYENYVVGDPAYLYDGAGYIDLADPLATGGTFVSAISGDVVVGTFISDRVHGFVAIVPEPALTVVTCFGALLAILGRHRKRRDFTSGSW